MTVVRSFLLRNVVPPILLLLLTSLLLPSYPSSASARTWHVKNDLTGDWETIQIAINYAASGDTILVGPGTYGENLVIDGKELVLKSEVGPEATTLSGSLQPGSVIFCTGGLTNATVIQGFTITEGQGTDPFSTGSRGGGGIGCLNAAPIIRGNRIVNNRVGNIPPNPDSAGSRGGGISFGGQWVVDLPPIVIEDNVIVNNVAQANGGGINIAGPSIITNNLIENNFTEHGDGGGLYYHSSPGPIIIHMNYICNNIASDHGGGIYMAASFPNSPGPTELQITQNIIIGNEASERIAGDGAGGGVWIFGGANLFGNTIAFNVGESAQFPPIGGVDIVAPRVGSVLEANIVQGNHGGGIALLHNLQSVIVTLKHNIVYSNELTDIYDPNHAINDIDNISVDALFCTEGALSRGELAVNSPALLSPFGILGAVSTPGCGPVATMETTWGQLKLRYQGKHVQWHIEKGEKTPKR